MMAMVGKVKAPPTSAAMYSGDGRFLILLGTDGRIRYADAQTGAVHRTLPLQLIGSRVGGAGRIGGIDGS
jgi:hypothetical protein